MAQTGALSMVLVYNLVVAPRWLAGEQARHTRCDLPLCGRYEHNEGRWMSLDRHKNARRPPPCCGWDKYKWGGQENGRWMFKDDVEHCGDVPMATDPELLNGSKGLSRAFWYKGGDDYLVHLGGYGCSCQKFGFEDLYRWFPDKCRLVEWDARDLYSLLGQRTLWVVGDSDRAAAIFLSCLCI